jgi:hypothetical protein
VEELEALLFHTDDWRQSKLLYTFSLFLNTPPPSRWLTLHEGFPSRMTGNGQTQKKKRKKKWNSSLKELMTISRRCHINLIQTNQKLLEGPCAPNREFPILLN